MSLPKKDAEILLRSLRVQAKENEHKIGLLPKKGWSDRNMRYWGKIVFPQVFIPRTRCQRQPDFHLPDPNDVSLTWIGHATFFLHTASQNILIDPNWALWHGPVKRIRHPGVALEDLPPVDVVLVSHAHFDHLHLPSLPKLKGRDTIIVPQGVGSLVKNSGFKRIIELDHWESVMVGDTKYTLTPARHWGARMIHDTYRKFGGYLIQTPAQTIYHGGDSAMFDGFQEIGKRADIDISILPIGAYDSPSGRPVHMNPEEAMEAFGHLNAKRTIPMHYGTFPLGGEPMWEPLARMMDAARRMGVHHKVDVMVEGNPIIYKPNGEPYRQHLIL